MSLAQKCPVGLKVSLAQEMSSELVGSEVPGYVSILLAQKCSV